MDFDINEFDIDVANEVKDMVGDRFSTMIEYYVEDAENYINAIKSGLESGNKEQVAQSAHPLKSSSRSMGGMGIGSIAEHVEHTAKQAMETGADIDELNNIIPLIEEAFVNIKGRLESLLKG